MPALPPVTDLTNAASKAAFKTGLAAAWAYLSGLFGTAGTQASALAALGTPFAAVETRSAGSSIGAADRGKFIQATGTWTLSLGAAATLGAGFQFFIKNAGAGTITLDGNAAETVAGSATVAIAPGGVGAVICTGAAWEVLPFAQSLAGGSVNWGSIGGTLSSQTDLAAALAVFDRTKDGRVPQAPAGTGTTKFLREDGTWVAPTGQAPGGSATEIQYRNGAAFAGAADALIDGGQILLPIPGSPPAAPTSGVKLFGPARNARPHPHFGRLDGTIRAVQQALAHTGLVLAKPVGDGNTGIALIGTTLTAMGTATGSALSTSTRHTRRRRLDYLITTAAAGAIAGYRGGQNPFTVGSDIAGLGGFYYNTIWGPATGVSNTSKRGFTGLSSVVSPPSDVDPSTLVNQIGMGCDAGDTNWQIMHNDNGGTSTKIDLGSGFPVSSADRTDLYDLTLYSPPGTSQAVYYEVVNLTTGAVASGQITTNLPGTTTFLGFRAWMSSGVTSAVSGYALFSLYAESDS